MMTRDTIAAGRIRLSQSKTSNAVDVPLVDPLREALAAGSIGATYLFETKDGAPFTPKSFYGMLKKACVAAGVPKCTPHGLRKSAARRYREAGCTDEEGIAIKFHSGRSDEEKLAMADAIAAALHETMGYDVADVSVAVEETDREDWMA